MYPNYPYFAVAITRTCGSGGGSYIGKQLAKAFDIDLYDRKLLRLASEDSGISEELFAHADENTRKTMLYRVSERVYCYQTYGGDQYNNQRVHNKIPPRSKMIFPVYMDSKWKKKREKAIVLVCLETKKASSP